MTSIYANNTETYCNCNDDELPSALRFVGLVAYFSALLLNVETIAPTKIEEFAETTYCKGFKRVELHSQVAGTILILEVQRSSRSEAQKEAKMMADLEVRMSVSSLGHHMLMLFTLQRFTHRPAIRQKNSTCIYQNQSHIELEKLKKYLPNKRLQLQIFIFYSCKT